VFLSVLSLGGWLTDLDFSLSRCQTGQSGCGEKRADTRGMHYEDSKEYDTKEMETKKSEKLPLGNPSI
jgi:hypothetical protein